MEVSIAANEQLDLVVDGRRSWFYFALVLVAVLLLALFSFRVGLVACSVLAQGG